MAIATLGFDPLRVTLISVALTVVIMPLVVLPFLVLMNDEAVRRTAHQRAVRQRPARALTILGALMAIVVIPLEIFRRLMMDVVRDVLDKNVVDRNGREMGRVDGILLDHEPGPARSVSRPSSSALLRSAIVCTQPWVES